MSEWFDAEAHADRALEMFERGRWAEAEAELRKALAMNPDHPDWHYNLGLTLEAAGRDPEALASFERAVELLPDLVEPLVSAGLACQRLQRWSAALQWFDRVLVLEPQHAMAFAQKIDALVALGDHDEAEATFYLAEHTLEERSGACLAAVAESLMERGEHGRAAWCLRESLRLEPRLPRVRARLAAVLAATGEPRQALQMFLRDLRDDPGNIDTLLEYGDLLIDLGRLPEAAEKFRRVLELEPANIEAHERLGQVAMISGRFEQAHLEFELVLKLDPSFPQIRVALSEVMLRRGQAAAARQCLAEELEGWAAADAEGPSPAACERLGDALLAADMPAEAGPCFAAVIERAHESETVLRKLAIARFRSDDISGGVVASRRVLRHDPDSVVAMHNLALAALRAGQLRLAAGWVARGLRVDGHDDGLRRLRAQVGVAAAKAWLRRRLRWPWRRG